MSKSGLKPHRARGNIVVFWLGLFVLLSALCAVLLLAHDGRNLRRVADILNIDLSEPETIVAHKTPKTSRLPASGKQLTKARLTTELMGPLASFVSVMPDGQTLCDALRKQGVPISKWAPDALKSGAFECSWERVFGASRVRPDGSERLFMIVKGHEDEAAGNVRVKFVLGSPKLSSDMTKTLTKIVDAFNGLEQWRGVAGASSQILTVSQYEKDDYALSVRFRQEMSRPGNYNLVIYPNPKGAEQKRTAAYFKRSSFLKPFGGPAWNCWKAGCERQLLVRDDGRDHKISQKIPQVTAPSRPDEKLETGSIERAVSKTHFDKN
ncbi:DUF6030 family protein [Rhizobium sp. FKL33]|uniref:DUF6030 family protein n=1 Tax=Rhizobium sp. FKL33 TaxID=2562307 RepID=UPI0010C02BEE|nr:DUF6030 family protein [Rhizobium sp. FKL33]